jgi:hypothetical protein
VHREQWDQQTLVYRPLDKSDPNLSFSPPGLSGHRSGYLLRLSRAEQQLVSEVKKLLEEQPQCLCQQEDGVLPRICFCRHLYQPLLLKNDKVEITPPGLNESEKRFVEDLCNYWNRNREGSLAGKDIYLLRNLSRGYGISFFGQKAFYPDFIVWIIDEQARTQRIVFVEPHGMLHAAAYKHDDKAQLWERLPELGEEIRRRSGAEIGDVSMDAYIVSATPYDELYKRYDDGNWDKAKFAEHHILFPDNNLDYIRAILESSVIDALVSIMRVNGVSLRNEH